MDYGLQTLNLLFYIHADAHLGAEVKVKHKNVEIYRLCVTFVRIGCLIFVPNFT